MFGQDLGLSLHAEVFMEERAGSLVLLNSPELSTMPGETSGLKEQTDAHVASYMHVPPTLTVPRGGTQRSNSFNTDQSWLSPLLWAQLRSHVMCKGPFLCDEFKGHAFHLHLILICYFITSIGQHYHMERELGIPAACFRNIKGECI